MKNAPFRDLLPQYIPISQLGHRPPRLSFGFPIRDGFDAFRQVALKKKLARPKVVKKSDYYTIGPLVLGHLNKLCDLPPGKDLCYNMIHSKEGDVIIELKTNYKEQVPDHKMVEAIVAIKELFELPDDAEPKWYLENDIDLRGSNEFLFPSESLVVVLHNSRDKRSDDHRAAVHIFKWVPIQPPRLLSLSSF